jgi:transposase
MGRAKTLSEHEKGMIQVYKEQGLSCRAIALKLKRSDYVIRHFLKDTVSYGQRKSSGRPSVLSARDKRRILNLASNSLKSCSSIQRELDLNVCRTSVWNVLKRSTHIVRAKLLNMPRLTKMHKSARVDFTKQNMATQWNKVSAGYSEN